MIFSDHFKTTIKLLGLCAILLVGLFLWARHKWNNSVLAAAQPVARATTLLTKQDREAVSYDSISHILTVATSSGTVRSYTRDPIIRIQKDGRVLVQKKLAALELAPFVGFGFADHARGYAGVYCVNVWRFDAGPAVGYYTGSARLNIVVGYNFWRNTSVNVAVDSEKTIGGFFSVKF